MLEDVEGRLRDAVARDPQNIVSFDRAVGHNGAELYGLEADALGRRVIAKQRGNHVSDNADADGWLVAVCLQPQVEQTFVERCDMRRVFAHRRVRDHDVIVGNSACGEEVEVLLWSCAGLQTAKALTLMSRATSMRAARSTATWVPAP